MTGEQVGKISKRAFAVAAGGTILSALAAGFFTSAGEFAGSVVFPSTQMSNTSAAPTQNSIDTPSQPFAISPSMATSKGDAQQSLASAVPVEIDSVDLSFGAEGSDTTRAAACSAAVATATQRADYQCQNISKEQGASSYELVNGTPSCTQCGQLSSNWRCVTRVKAVCRIFE